MRRLGFEPAAPPGERYPFSREFDEHPLDSWIRDYRSSTIGRVSEAPSVISR